MRRREFLKNTIYIPAAGITVAYLVVTGCSSDDSTVVAQPSGTCTTSNAEIGANHGHSITPPTASEISTGAAIVLDLRFGTSSHAHSVSLTASELDTISTCVSVTKTSTRNVHTHQVTFTGIV
jgi:hypothetical protein